MGFDPTAWYAICLYVVAFFFLFVFRKQIVKIFGWARVTKETSGDGDVIIRNGRRFSAGGNTLLPDAEDQPLYAGVSPLSDGKPRRG